MLLVKGIVLLFSIWVKHFKCHIIQCTGILFNVAESIKYYESVQAAKPLNSLSISKFYRAIYISDYLKRILFFGR